ncbi:MAG: YdeI family protein [Oligoflexales bacterium]
MRIYKKDSEKTSITHQEALEEALCFGWIDGLKKSYDENSWIQKFTPRRKRSIWSKRNTVIAERLIKDKRMKASGLKAIAEAKADGRWEQAYASSKEMKISEEHLNQIKKNPKAYAFYKTLNKAQLYSIAFRLHAAKKEETRAKRLNSFIAKLAKGQPI